MRCTSFKFSVLLFKAGGHNCSEKEMATHSSFLAWRIPGMDGVAQSRTWLKWLSSSSNISNRVSFYLFRKLKGKPLFVRKKYNSFIHVYKYVFIPWIYILLRHIDYILHHIVICCFCSITQSCLTLCNSMDCSMPGFPVLHYGQEFAQTHVHWVDDATQPSHPLSPPFSSCPQPFPVAGYFPRSWLFGSSGQSIRASASASALPMNIQGSCPLGMFGLISLLSKGLFRVFSSITVQKQKIFHSQPSLWFNSHIHIWILEKP